MLVVAMYTPNTPYQEQIKVLEKSCEKFELNFKKYPIKNWGDWLDNCKMNTKIILKAMEEHPKENILYVDADAEFIRLPKLFIWFELQDVDIMAHILRYPKFTRACTGTLFLKNNNAVKGFLKDWQYLNKSNDELDDDNLLEALKGFANFEELPQEYCSIDICRAQTSHNPVIKHWQRSRKFKDGINDKCNNANNK
jgi:hypothetical protein